MRSTKDPHLNAAITAARLFAVVVNVGFLVALVVWIS
jgi:hypothetical protein